MFEKPDQLVRLLSFGDDQPNEQLGSLIPKSVREAEAHRNRRRSVRRVASFFTSAVLSIGAIGAFAFAAISGYGYVSATEQIAAPTVTIVDPDTFKEVSLSYGPQVALSQKNFFTETRDAFVDEKLSFIEIDLDSKMLRYFEDGVLVLSTEILALGEKGSWWDAPSGLYQVDSSAESEFSTIAQAEFPWAVIFEGNYMIHGWPRYPGGTPVADTFAGGGIRIDDEKAEVLYDAVKKNLPVLVHQKPRDVDQFVYEPTVPNIDTQHYLIADIENGAILAASDLDQAVPIASLTKLMTAVVTAERLDLDSRVQVSSPSFVQSLIPRLQDRSSVSMYSLLQLLLVESSNEAAEVIAGEYGREDFITEMNTKATKLGMSSTKFVDPSGLGSGNVSSLGDLYRLSEYIHDNRTFIFDITANGKVSTIEGLNEFSGLVNFNTVEDVDSFVGGKVGETNAAGQTSVSLHKIKIQGQDRIVVIILLGSAHRNDDVKLLIDFVQSRFDR
ncbi:MAG: L,D-transpeptidase family protein [Candidatus Pacebacteria bacterium]|nr:L,D-transpeptidase family protein [Candidatus Paceibacterota bacterium]MBP6924274.1 L,D-transpeptidase family protein [Candidatus Paceibacterota bacterium]